MTYSALLKLLVHNRQVSEKHLLGAIEACVLKGARIYIIEEFRFRVIVQAFFQRLSWIAVQLDIINGPLVLFHKLMLVFAVLIRQELHKKVIKNIWYVSNINNKFTYNLLLV